MDRIFYGAAGKLHISEPELYVDNQARRRSGHMSHAMIEYQPGRIIDFNSNCSAVRSFGHSAFGWIEYRYSEDYGRHWSEVHELPYSKQEFFDGNYTISIEKGGLPRRRDHHFRRPEFPVLPDLLRTVVIADGAAELRFRKNMDRTGRILPVSRTGLRCGGA